MPRAGISRGANHMKLKLIALLKTSFASKGFSQKTLEGIADVLIANNNLTDQSTDEEVTAGIEAIKPMTDLMQSEISRQVNEQKPKPVETPTPTPVVTPEAPTTTDPVLLALLAELKELKTGLATVQGEKVATTRREQYAKTLEGLPDSLKNDKLADFDLLNFKDDDHFNTWNESKAESVKVLIQEAADAGLGGDRPQGGTGGVTTESKKVAPAVAAFIAKQDAARKTAVSSEN